MADNSTDIEALTYYFQALQPKSYAALAGVVLLAFDTLLTLSDEIDLIWRSKKRIITLLYLLARYGGFLTLAFDFVALHPTFNLVATLQGYLWFAPCDFSNERVINIVGVLNDLILISFEAGLLPITIYQARRLRSLAREYNCDGFRSLSDVVLQQGIICFAVIFTWNLIGTIVDEVFSDSPFIGIDVPLENAVTIILVCRFTLQFRSQNFFTTKTYITPPVTARQSVNTRRAVFSRIRDSITSSFEDNERMVNHVTDELEEVDGRLSLRSMAPVKLADDGSPWMPPT